LSVENACLILEVDPLSTVSNDYPIVVR
jgi:hypothetical protein